MPQISMAYAVKYSERGVQCGLKDVIGTQSVCRTMVESKHYSPPPKVGWKWPKNIDNLHLAGQYVFNSVNRFLKLWALQTQKHYIIFTRNACLSAEIIVSKHWCHPVTETIKSPWDKRQKQSSKKQASELTQKKKEEGREEGGGVKWGKKGKQTKDCKKHEKLRRNWSLKKSIIQTL